VSGDGREHIAAQLSHAYYNGLDRKGWSQYEEKEAVDRIMRLIDAQYNAGLTAAEGAKVTGETSDGYHTFNELYHFRMLYNAALFNQWYLDRSQFTIKVSNVHKSKRHSDGELCFGGGWFVVVADLPTGQISNHYEEKYWEMFRIETRKKADVWDGHTPKDVADRLEKFLAPQYPIMIKGTDHATP
jgi:hypothetical protein